MKYPLIILFVLSVGALFPQQVANKKHTTRYAKRKIVRIVFKKVPGVKYYEILLIKNILQKDQNTTLFKIKKSPITRVIADEFHFFRIRGVFNKKLSTRWSKAHRFSSARLFSDHHNLSESHNPIYQTKLSIQAPYFQRNKKIWVSSSSTFNFLPNKYAYIPKKEIYYRFRLEDEVGEIYRRFKHSFQLKYLFKNLESEYILEFYSVNNKKFREDLQKVFIIVDLQGPVINFAKEKGFYVWHIKDISPELTTAVYVNNTLYKKYTQSKIYIEEHRIDKKKNIRLETMDFFGNKATWDSSKSKK